MTNPHPSPSPALSGGGHTPGPWRVSLTDDTVVVTVDGSEVASIDGDYNEPDLWPIMEANARLIASAPSLLSALREAREALEAFSNVSYMTEIGLSPSVQSGDLTREHFRQARETLAKIDAALAIAGEKA